MKQKIWKGLVCKPLSPKQRYTKYRLKYGITLDDRQALYAKQHGYCAICKTKLEINQLHTDHDHVTGIVRGLLCPNCNHGLGFFHDDPAMLKVALSYLQNPPSSAPLFYEGKPCKNCNGTKHYTKGRSCVDCKRKRSKLV